MHKDSLPSSKPKAFWMECRNRASREAFDGFNWLLTIGAFIAAVTCPTLLSIFFPEWAVDVSTWTIILPTLLLPTLYIWHIMRAARLLYKERDDLAKDTEKMLAKEIEGYKEREKPRLEFVFDKSTPDCLCHDNTGAASYLHLLVKNISGVDVLGCHGIFNSIQVVAGDSYPQGRQVLPFAPSHQKDSASKTLTPGSTWPLDIFRIDTATQNIAIATRGEISEVRGSREKNTNHPIYHFWDNDRIKNIETVLEIEISANGITTVVKHLKFVWSGNISTCQFSIID